MGQQWSRKIYFCFKPQFYTFEIRSKILNFKRKICTIETKSKKFDKTE